MIEPNLFSHQDDVRRTLFAIRTALGIANTTVFRRYGAKPFATPMPGCEDHEHFSDAYWECAMKTMPFLEYHETGTCRYVRVKYYIIVFNAKFKFLFRMGPKTDKNSVVDPELRVHGIKNLRVADASIMPRIITGNINTPVMMIGEKASDMIKKDHGLLRSPRYSRG